MENLSKRHHEYKIAYLQDQISKLPHGFFGKCRGESAVIIFFDPDNPKVTGNSKRWYSTQSKKGQHYASQVRLYTELKGQLDLLLKDWKSKYVTPPRKIKFPLHKTRKDPLDLNWFTNSKAQANERKNNNPIKYKNHVLRSKNELAACQVIDKMGFPQKVEVLVRFDNLSYFYPDSTFYVPEIDKVILLNIDGALDNPQYISKSYYDTAACLTNGLVEGKDFIVLRIGNAKDMDAGQLENLIRAAIESSIDDIAD